MNWNYREIETARDYRIAEFRRQAQEDAFAKIVIQYHSRRRLSPMAAVRSIAAWIKAHRPQTVVPASTRDGYRVPVTRITLSALFPRKSDPSND